MVNVTSLERIIQFINQENLRTMKDWKTRLTSRGGNWSRLLKNIRIILNLISGNNIVDMLKSKQFNCFLRSNL